MFKLFILITIDQLIINIINRSIADLSSVSDTYLVILYSLYVSLCVRVYACVYVCISVCLSMCQSVYLLLCLSVSFSVRGHPFMTSIRRGKGVRLRWTSTQKIKTRVH